MQAKLRQTGRMIDYTPASAVAIGAVVVLGELVCVCERAIAANELGALSTEGIYDFVKVNAVMSRGDKLYWDEDGDPHSGTAGTGAATTDGSKGKLIGFVLTDALAGDTSVRALLCSDPQLANSVSTTTVAATGSIQGDAAAIGTGFTLVTAGDGTKGVKLPPAAAGKMAIVKNGAGAILKVYPDTSDAINALSANASLNMAANTSAVLVAYNDVTWYTVPLLPS